MKNGNTVYDCIIIGGGPAGLSAAIYLSRFNRSTLIIDKESGRWDTHEINENYLGFPNGIPAKKLRQKGLEQALTYGAFYQKDNATDIIRHKTLFKVLTPHHTFASRSIILATGVKDNFPLFEKWKDYLGKSLFWCITCDGYKTIGKKVAVVGQTNDAACTALQILNFTNHVLFITHCLPGQHTLSTKWLEYLKKSGIPFYEGIIQEVKGHRGYIDTIILDNQKELHCTCLFNQQESIPKTELGHKLHLKTDEHGYILTDKNQRTNIPFVYAAGDVTKNYAHQIVTAAHEGSMAAQTANYDLYNPEQRIA